MSWIWLLTLGSGPGCLVITDDDLVDRQDVDRDGYAAGPDCDDTDPTISPDADELCGDGIDNDCDDEVDEADAIDAALYYEDLDGDGYGTNLDSQTACTPPEGFAAALGDCDDEAAEVHPGVLEVCGDGVDNDCSEGDVGACNISGDRDVNEAALNLIGSDVLGAFSSSLAFAGDTTGDGITELVVGARYEDWGGELSGAVYVLASDQRGHLQASVAAHTTVKGVEDDAFVGESLSAIGDYDGDGLDDLLIGSGYLSSQAAWLMLGGTTGSLPTSTLDVRFEKEGENDTAGEIVEGLGDLDGDGQAEFAISKPDDKLAGLNSGAVYVFGADLPEVASLEDAFAVITGEERDASAGQGLASAGDVDGDGHGDLLVGAPGDSQAFSEAGAVYLVLGPPITSSLAGAWLELRGSEANQRIGYCVTGAGDVDGDDLSDVIVGSPYASTYGPYYSGSVFILTDLTKGTHSIADLSHEVYGSMSNEYAGLVCSPGGDQNGDGLAEVVGGSIQADKGDTPYGAAWVFTSPFEGHHERAAADAHLWGSTSSEQAGHSLDGGHDVDGDGYDDLLVGSRYGGASSQGSAHLWLGGPLDE